LDLAIDMEIIDFYKGELADSFFYRELARREKNPNLKEKLLELSKIESGHAKFWESVLKKYNVPYDSKISTTRLRYLILLKNLFGISFIINFLEGGEAKAIEDYSKFADQTNDPEIKLKLQDIIEDEKNHEQAFIQMSQEFSSNAEKTKDSIYGMSDGLIEVLAGVAGLTGVLSNNFYVFIGGLIFAISGMISMTIGAFISTRASSQIKGGDNEYSSISAAANTAFFYFIGAVFPLIPFIFLPKYISLAIAIILALIIDALAASVISISSRGNLRRDVLVSLALISIGILATFLVGEIVHHFLGNII